MHDRPYRILFVCTGNLCRSPMAEGILRYIAQESGINDLEVRSAGTWAAEGHPAARNALLVCRAMGIDLTDHRSRSIVPAEVAGSDLVIAMEAAHVQTLRLMDLERADHIHTLKSWGPGAPGGDVGDPMGHNLEFFTTIFEELDVEIRRILPGILDDMKRKRGR